MVLNRITKLKIRKANIKKSTIRCTKVEYWLFEKFILAT